MLWTYSNSFDDFCLDSSNSDFTRLAARIRESCLVVYGFGEHKTPKPFVSACDKFIYFENLAYDEQLAVPQERAAIVEPLNEEDSSTTIKSDTRLKRLLQMAVEAASDDEGWANLANVGGHITRQFPDFDPRRFGYLKLRDLVIATDVFDIDRRSPGEGKATVVYARAKRSKHVNGARMTSPSETLI
ncbi:hypothetical protein CGCTS75_v007843 [Colletotrichum tropicale]|nr:hypothetical protein CGCTS75_v007843 [Colletotrichum tropicale]